MLQSGGWKCPGLVAKARERGSWGKAPGATIAGGQSPTKKASRGMAWVVKPQGLNKKSPMELGVGALPGCPYGVQSPEVADPCGCRSPSGAVPVLLRSG
jgi:hypothetical protein